MSATTIGGVTFGVIDGVGSITQHLQELSKNPNDSTTIAQVNADFANLSAAATAIVPGLGASTAFVALSADINLVIQKARKGEAPSKGDLVPILGNLVTIAGQVVEAAGVAGTPVTAGTSTVAGITVGESLDTLGAGISLYGLNIDKDDVRATLGQIASSIESIAGSTPTTNIPQVVVTGERVTTIGYNWSSDGQTLTENLSDQSTRYTTISPDGTSVTKMYKESDGQISSTQVQNYTDANRSTLSSTVESTLDPTTNRTEITTTNYNSQGNASTFNTQVIDNDHPGSVIGTASGTLNADGSVSGGTVSGTGVGLNSNDATINVNNGAQGNSSATIEGSDLTVNATAGSTILIGDNGATNTNLRDTLNISNGTVSVLGDTNANILGDNNHVTSAGDNSYFGVYGSNNNTTGQAGISIWTGGIGSDNALDTVNANGGVVTVTDSSNAVVGSASTLYLGNTSAVTENGDNTNVNMQGNGDSLYVAGSGVNTNVTGSGDATSVHGSNDLTTDTGNYDTTDNYGISDRTYDNGSYDHNFNYGADEYAWSANSTDTNYNEYSSDTGGGYGEYGYGGYGYGGGGGGGYYYYGGTARNSPGDVKATGTSIEALVQFDKAAGHHADAAQLTKAWAQIENAIANGSTLVMSGASWKHDTVTWSLANVGGQFSGAMGATEEQAVQKAFEQWSAATGLKFQEVDSQSQSDIRIGWGNFDTADSGVVGLTGVFEKGGKITKATVRLENPSDDPLVTNASGAQVYAGTDASFDQVLLHELGHALGFGDNVDPTSIESYQLTSADRGLSTADVAAAASLYGKTAKHATSTQAEMPEADGLVQAMSAFAPVPMASATAANDIDDYTRHVYGTPMKVAVM